MRTLHKLLVLKKVKCSIAFMENILFVCLTDKKLFYAWENNLSTAK